MSGLIIAIVVALHVIVCVALMAAILLQSGKGGGLAGAFGAGSSQTLFGGRGAASFLSRATTVLAVVFFLTSLTLGLQASRRESAGGSKSLIQEEARRRSQERPVQPAGSAPPPAGTTASPQVPPGASPQSLPGASPQAPSPNATPGGSPAPSQTPAAGGTN